MVDTPQELGAQILPDCALSSLAPWQRTPKIGGSKCSVALIIITHSSTTPLINLPKPTFRASWGLSLTSATYGGKTANPVRLPTTRHRPLSWSTEKTKLKSSYSFCKPLNLCLVEKKYFVPPFKMSCHEKESWYMRCRIFEDDIVCSFYGFKFYVTKGINIK